LFTVIRTVISDPVPTLLGDATSELIARLAGAWIVKVVEPTKPVLTEPTPLASCPVAEPWNDTKPEPTAEYVHVYSIVPATVTVAVAGTGPVSTKAPPLPIAVSNEGVTVTASVPPLFDTDIVTVNT
jgi:hypothetical protein